MVSSGQLISCLLGLYTSLVLCQRNQCTIKQGLPCNSTEKLLPGSSFTISSKTCPNGNYPSRERCAWYFEVEGCKPSLKCNLMSLKAKGRKCRGDRLKVETENRRKAFCQRNARLKKGFTDERPTSFFDIKFSSNRKDEGRGFKCTVSCSEDAPVTTTTPPTESDCSCGKANRKNKIVGGAETDNHEYPWQVAIVSNGENIPFCGGAILSSTTIITAAHCTLGQSVDTFKVVVNEHDVTVDDGQEVFDICAKNEHPNYSSRTNAHDIAILTLCKPVTFTPKVGPVCLPEQQGDAYDDVLSTVTGWGTLSLGGPQSDVLMGVDMNTIGNTECDSDYGGGVIDNSMICAKAPGKDACQGDSGGPLVTKEPGDYYSLIGIVSFGAGCADPNFPGVYARVTEDLAWIKENTSGKQCQGTRKLFTRLLNKFDLSEED